MYYLEMTVTDRINRLLLARGVKARSIKPTLARVCDISYSAVSQWFSESTKSIKPENLQSIAREYGSSVDWLLSGQGEMLSTPDSTKEGIDPTSKGVNYDYHVPVTPVPLIDWDAVEAWCKSANAGPTETYMPCPDQLGPRGFATVVEGDAMRNPTAHEDSYPHKTIIYVDPDVKAEIGDPVLVLQQGSDVPIFRILTRDGGRDILKPLNPQYPILQLGAGDEFMGVVCGYFRRTSRG